MVGVSIAEGTRLSLLLARRGMRNAIGRLRGHPLLRWNVFPNKTDRLVIAPQDLRTLPCHLPDSEPRRSGLDGFYAARIEKKG